MRVLFVVAQENFRDEEYSVPKGIVEKAGVSTATASPDGGVCRGVLGGRVKADLKLSDVKPGDYDAVVVVGGGGSQKYLWNNRELHGILKSAFDGGRVVAAICLSGAVLAKAGVLKGREATVFETPESLKALRDGGAKHVREDVVVDGKVITAVGPQAAAEFGERIVEALGT